jgi:hypothetical protein
MQIVVAAALLLILVWLGCGRCTVDNSNEWDLTLGLFCPSGSAPGKASEQK